MFLKVTQVGGRPCYLNAAQVRIIEDVKDDRCLVYLSGSRGTEAMMRDLICPAEKLASALETALVSKTVVAMT